MRQLRSIEVCAGAGGQALGLERAGFAHDLLLDNDPHCVASLRLNRPHWNVLHQDLRDMDAQAFRGIDLFAGGLPCPPFSVAGKQLGPRDERNLFDDALRLIEQSDPRMVLIENVKGFLDPAFADYRDSLRARFSELGYCVDWRLVNASDFGVPQLRPRVAIVAGKPDVWQHFRFPSSANAPPRSVGETLLDLMAAEGWPEAAAWAARANSIAPTIVGGSKKHGGPDLGPTRARKAWEAMGVNGKTIAETAPPPDHVGLPRLTTRMVARLQGFPDTWQFSGKKTNAYRQVGNAFPPPVAMAIGLTIRDAIHAAEAGKSKPKVAAA